MAAGPPPPGSSSGAASSSLSKTNLSHILPASAACHILGEDAVRAVVRSFLRHVAGSAGAGRGPAGSGVGSVGGVGGTGNFNASSGNGSGNAGSASMRPPSSQGSLSASQASQQSQQLDDPYAGLDDPTVPFPRHLFAESTLQPGESEEETEWVNAVGRALFYDFESRRGGVGGGGTAGMGGGEEAVAAGGWGPGQIPPEVWAVWARLTRIPSGGGALGLDKAGALSLGVLVPFAALPHAGPGGHMALFECLFHALAASPNANNAAGGMASGGSGAVKNLKSRVEEQMMGGAASAARVRSVLLLPDLIIFFAICRKYRAEATTPQLSKSEGRRYATLLASLLAFRVYDGYQKRGLVSRDTVHRFFADVHGEDSFQRPAVRRVLDALFTVEELGGGTGGGGDTRQQREKPHVTPAEFCRGISTTTNLHPATGHQSHVLLDWVLALGNSTLPETLLPSPSMHRLLRDKMDLLAVANPDRAVGSLCKKYRLGQGDLYEVKRRFRSVVELMSETDASADGGGGDEDDEGGGGKSNLPLEEDPTAAAAASAASTLTASGGPRNVIRKAAFIKAVSEAHETDGQGGYLTTALAELTFVGGWIMGNRRRRGDEDDKYWAMTDVLSFGCRAVRGDAMDPDPSGSEAGLLRFVFGTFLMLPRGQDGATENENEDDPGVSYSASNDDASSVAEDMSTLNRVQIGHMIELLVEHWAFRLATDSPPENDGDSDGDDDDDDDGGGEGSDASGSNKDEEEEESSEEEFDSDYSGEEDEEDYDSDEEGEGEQGRELHKQASEHIVVDESKVKTVDVTAASLLGMLPPNVDSSETTVTGRVKLDLLIDYVLDESLPSSEVGEGGYTDKPRPPSLTFPGFLNWYHSTSSSSAHLPKSDRRCGPYMLDLRLLGSILFGVRPSRPSMEQELVEEVQRRHKYRYPHMGKNLRGPPGTVWFVINVTWWRKWLNYCQGKEGVTASRLGRIDNNVLLENGSLAMRAGLRWKYDFEVRSKRRISVSPLFW